MIDFSPTLVLAQTAPGIAEAITGVTSGLQPIFIPLAMLGLTIFFLLMIGSPVLPEAAQQNKGYFMKVCVVLIVVGMLPTITAWLFSLGGGSAGAQEEAVYVVPALLRLLRGRQQAELPAELYADEVSA